MYVVLVTWLMEVIDDCTVLFGVILWLTSSHLFRYPWSVWHEDPTPESCLRVWYFHRMWIVPGMFFTKKKRFVYKGGNSCLMFKLILNKRLTNKPAPIRDIAPNVHSARRHPDSLQGSRFMKRLKKLAPYFHAWFLQLLIQDLWLRIPNEGREKISNIVFLSTHSLYSNHSSFNLISILIQSNLIILLFY